MIYSIYDVIESGQQIDEKAFEEALKYFGYDKVLQDNALLGELVMALVAQVNQRQARIEAARETIEREFDAVIVSGDEDFHRGWLAGYLKALTSIEGDSE